MALVNAIRREWAVVWLKTGTLDDGSSTYAAPEEIKVRWEGATEEIYVAFETLRDSKEVIYHKDPIPKGSYVCKGRLTDIVSGALADPTLQPNVRIVERNTTFPSIRYNPNKILRISGVSDGG